MRDEIADVDRAIVELVAKRFYLAAQVGLEKRFLDRALRDEDVEEIVRKRLLTECDARGISVSFSESLVRLLIEESLRWQGEVRKPRPAGQRILVVGGAGRMGRWICRYFRSRGCSLVVNDLAGPVEGYPFESDLARGVREADVIAVSVPMSVAAKVLQNIAAVSPKGLVFDVCSLKAPVERELRAMGRAGLRVASVHPMFGPTSWPLSSGSITFSDCGNGVAVTEAKELFRATGASLVDVSLDQHDDFMASLLGLSHLCLLTFARGVARSPLDLAVLKHSAGTTFSRLSAAAEGLLADSPGLLREIQALNPHTPSIHRRIRDILGEWQQAAAAPDGDAFLRLVEQTRAYFGGIVT